MSDVAFLHVLYYAFHRFFMHFIDKNQLEVIY